MSTLRRHDLYACGVQLLALIRRRTEQFSEQQFEMLLESEAQRVRQLHTEGIIRTVYTRGDVKGAVVVLECASREEGESVLATLPLAQEGMLEIQLLTLLPYRGFAPR